MNIRQSTAAFEKWLREQLADRGTCDQAALIGKHAAMKKEGAHAFLRGTFYRWAELWKDVTDGGSRVLAVGDTHVENFGTWRDQEGRLVWGVNDFDEACTLPWTSDLVRLAVSTTLAWSMLKKSRLSEVEACAAIWDGYADAVGSGHASALVLAERHDALRDFALELILSRPPEKFWKKKEARLEPARNMPRDARTTLTEDLLDGAVNVEFLQPRRGDPPGMGSRGKRRYYALAIWRGARILREVKPVVPSAMAWATSDADRPGLAEMLATPRRCPDPFQKLRDKWVVRRLAADSSKIELEDMHGLGYDQHRERKVFESMGAEIANLHLGSISAGKLRRELHARGTNAAWLRQATKDWMRKVKDDFAEFCRAPE